MATVSADWSSKRMGLMTPIRRCKESRQEWQKYAILKGKEKGPFRDTIPLI